MLDYDKSNYENNTLFINGKSHELGDLITFFKTKE